ncbi:adenylate cyclase [Thecamonas trahens ATCC 50062]|uniref:Adenylate cyclase n=1 Tax=Thecamonas trahens ATCC 50062 TaxID=461836 RepID=A0A0L0D9B5_THETB|nr:adenylate cyclase [Thecamonas trahens ATCC 50062]KNC48934.1 adenylate cyclase [Thecamonas trahens ATCC 50062]|eukprot:XP_013758351.1 adenylate cyclase [Thecamonas trahens ATCC 50062]
MAEPGRASAAPDDRLGSDSDSWASSASDSEARPEAEGSWSGSGLGSSAALQPSGRTVVLEGLRMEYPGPDEPLGDRRTALDDSLVTSFAMAAPGSLLRLTYCSVETKPWLASELDASAGRWAAANVEAGITGVLVYVAGLFFHVLEGPARAVNALYLRIARDERHGECFVINLETAPLGDRLYSEFIFQRASSQPQVYTILKNVLASLSSSYQILERYLPPVVLYQLKQGLNPFDCQPRIVDALVVFVGLTNTQPASAKWLSDAHYPTFIVLLSELYEHVTSSIVRAGGEVVKFIGKDVMVCFPEADVLPALHALHNLHVLLTVLCDRSSLPGASVAMGACAGPVVELNIGSVDFEKLDYTLLGNVVNTASRFKSLAASLGHDLVVAPSVAELIAPGGASLPAQPGAQLAAAEWTLVSLGEHVLKGLADPQPAFTVVPPSTRANSWPALPPRELLPPRPRLLDIAATHSSSFDLLRTTIELTSSPKSPPVRLDASGRYSIDHSIAQVADRVDHALDNASFRLSTSMLSSGSPSSSPSGDTPLPRLPSIDLSDTPRYVALVAPDIRGDAAYPRSPDKTDLARALQVTLSEPKLPASPIRGLQHLANRRMGGSFDSRRHVDVASLLATGCDRAGASAPTSASMPIQARSVAAAARARSRARKASVSTPPPIGMLRVTYVSLASSSMPSSEWASLVDKWRMRNLKRGITGQLLRSSSGEVLMQILEGPASAVDALFARIAADPRHHHVTRVGSETIVSREHHGFSAEVFSFDSTGPSGELVVEHMIRLMLDTMLTSYVSLRGYTQKKVLDILQTGANPLAHYSHPVRAVILVTDILDFTRITEVVGLNAELVVELINTFLEIVISAVERGGGSVNKLIGDCVVAFFPPHSRWNAVHVALDIQRRLAAARAAAGEDSILSIMYSGVGLASGRVFLGNIGVTRLDFAMIGAAVDDAHDLESATRSVDAALLISPNLFRELEGNPPEPPSPSPSAPPTISALPLVRLGLGESHAYTVDSPDARWDVADVQATVNAHLEGPVFALPSALDSIADLANSSPGEGRTQPMSLHALSVSPIVKSGASSLDDDGSTRSDGDDTGRDGDDDDDAVDLNELLSDDVSFMTMVTASGMLDSPSADAVDPKLEVTQSGDSGEFTINSVQRSQSFDMRRQPHRSISRRRAGFLTLGRSGSPGSGLGSPGGREDSPSASRLAAAVAGRRLSVSLSPPRQLSRSMRHTPARAPWQQSPTHWRDSPASSSVSPHRGTVSLLSETLPARAYSSGEPGEFGSATVSNLFASLSGRRLGRSSDSSRVGSELRELAGRLAQALPPLKKHTKSQSGPAT